MTSTSAPEATRATGYSVRMGEASDAECIAQVHRQVWRATYSELVAPEVLKRHLNSDDATTRWTSRLERSGADAPPVWVGVDPEGEIVALGCSGPPRDPDHPVGWELWAINVMPSAQGTGLADMLMERLVADLPAYLWVMEDNARAIAFYERHGFVLDGLHHVDEDFGTVDVRMTRRGTHGRPVSGRNGPTSRRAGRNR
ncbi:MAG: GNAT family N-acetyltransferase [Dermatophilus congolensis]|nr:GNAT family N-acetyltransferase [Dermatophilus congolensis]